MEKQPEIPAVLTKENFWNELMEKYPNEMKLFCAWIDEYKKRVNWDRLFDRLNYNPTVSAAPFNADINVGVANAVSMSVNGVHVFPSETKALILSTPIPKFHEIPIAMQVGIFFQYVTESKCDCGSYWGDFRGMNGFIEAMRLWFDTHNNFVSR